MADLRRLTPGAAGGSAAGRLALAAALALACAVPATASIPLAPVAVPQAVSAAPADPAAAQPAAVVVADEAAAPPAASAKELGDGRRTIRRLPKNLGWGVIGVFHKDNLVPLLAGGAATGIVSVWDDELAEWAEPGDWGESFETGAGPIWSTVFVASMFTAGRIAHGPRFRAMTYDMLDAAIVNFGYTALVKAVVRRERPNGENEYSFPSGHTSNAFSLAAVAERHYGWKLGLPAYLLAGVVGASRIQQDKHYLSDVVAGATLGYIVGRTVVRVNSRPLDGNGGGTRGARLDVAPLVGRKLRGVRVALSF